MKEKLAFTIGLIIICISLNLIHFNAFAQERSLIVLDIQEFHKKNKQQDSTVKEMIQNVNSLISHFDTAQVIYVKATGKALSISFKGISVDTIPAPPFDSRLTIASSNIFNKIEGDAFTSAELISFLESRKVKEIILVGLMAEKCIYNTALGGKSRDYDIIIVPEGIVGTTAKKKETAINEMKDKGIKFIPITEIIKTL
jgi:nicotinamidase-related amidase